MEIPYIEGCWQGQKNLHCKLKDIKNEDYGKDYTI